MAESPESTVLEEEIDESYEPSDEEIVEFASWMGMVLPQEHSLLWIAKQGLKAPLPAEWKPCRTEEDEIYYFNFSTGESSWEHPCDDLYRNLYSNQKRQVSQPARLVLLDQETNSLSKTTSSVLNNMQQNNSAGRNHMISNMHSSPGPFLEPAEAREEQKKVSEKEEEAVKMAPVEHKSMQTELLEKIKADLEAEGGSLMEQKRKEMIEELERQIEVERKRLQEIQNQSLKKELDLEQQTQEKKEIERKLAWEARLKEDEEERVIMKHDLDEKRKKREEDLANLIEQERKSFEAESSVRLESLRRSLREEEAKLVEEEKSRIFRSVHEKVQCGESMALEGMKQEAVERMKIVMRSLETSVYEHEFELVSDKVRAEAGLDRAQRQLRMESDVEAEVSRLRDTAVKHLMRGALQEIGLKVSSRIDQLVEETRRFSRLSSPRSSSRLQHHQEEQWAPRPSNESSIAQELSERILSSRERERSRGFSRQSSPTGTESSRRNEEQVNLVKKAAWEAVMNLVGMKL